MSFNNKVAIVTGGSSGIGAAIAVKLTAEGAKVAIVGRNQVKLTAVAQMCEHNNIKPLIIIADLTNEDNVKNIVIQTVRKFGKLDLLVNCAGISGTLPGILSAKALQDYDRVMATNLRPVVQLTHIAAPYLIETRGNIINISSVSALRPYSTTGCAYNASKAGLDHFSKSVAHELGAKGIRVNCINPGPVKTDMIKNAGIDEAQEEKMWNFLKIATALGRISDPEEVADLVSFLGSDKARGITGASFVIDNGTMIKN